MNAQPTPERLMQFAWGYAPTLIIEAAIQHRVFDVLDRSPMDLDQLSRETGASKRGLAAVANALVGLQFLAKSGNRYTLTPESGAFLVSHKPGFHGALFKHMSAQVMPRWLHLDDVVRTGRPAAAISSEADGAAFFVEFVEALFPLAYRPAKALGEHLGFAKLDRPTNVLDIAAGSGVWGIALAEFSPHVRISAVDWPGVLEVTKRSATRHKLADRLKTIPGDVLAAEFGSGYQVAVLGHILHSEGAERSRKLIQKTFKALAPGGTIVIAEFVPNDDRTGPPSPLIFSVNMLVSTEAGDTFTFAEMSDWLTAAGFVNPRQFDAGGVSPLILATKP